jgi:DNA-binding NtrC family response regulator
MSQQKPLILYVGDAEQGRAFLDTALARGAWVYLAEDVEEALGAYIAYSPDAVVLNAYTRPDTTAEAYHHLRSVEAQPIFILSEDRGWDRSVTEADSVYVLDPDTMPEEMLVFVSAALEQAAERVAFTY